MSQNFQDAGAFSSRQRVARKSLGVDIRLLQIVGDRLERIMVDVFGEVGDFAVDRQPIVNRAGVPIGSIFSDQSNVRVGIKAAALDPGVAQIVSKRNSKRGDLWIEARAQGSFDL